jgi:NitT/TauT family transport system substrate-binding protein
LRRDWGYPNAALGSARRRRFMASIKKITVESAEAVLGLHWFVAQGDGLFAAEGLDVEIVKPKAPPRLSPDDPRVRDWRRLNPFNYQTLFEEKKCEIYRACEWGQIRRTYDSRRGGPIVGKRPAVICQGIYVRPDSPVNAPIQLGNTPVGVQFHQGSHYATLAMLEGFLPRAEISVVHAGPVEQRYEMLESGEIDAATLMEPWITLAEKNGCKKIMEAHYLGVENVSLDLRPETFQALMRAIRTAVTHINAHKKRYLHFLIDEMPPQYARQITPNDFYLPRLRYVDPAPYTAEEFEKAYNWMVSWDLVAPDASYEKLVANAV